MQIRAITKTMFHRDKADYVTVCFASRLMYKKLQYKKRLVITF